MAELPLNIQKQIDELAEPGNTLLDEQDEWQKAIVVWQKALEILPQPRWQWEAASWFCASIGEAYWVGEEWKQSLDYFELAKKHEHGNNPFITFRIGTCLVQLGDEVKARPYLVEALQIAEDLFEDEPEFLAIDKKLEVRG